MILRPRQREFVTRCVGALKTHGNTLGVAPTGAGKTICLSGTAGEFLAHPDAKACVLAHRDELTAQNQSKFSRVNPGITHLGVRCPSEILGGSGHVCDGADPGPQS